MMPFYIISRGFDVIQMSNVFNLPTETHWRNAKMCRNFIFVGLNGSRRRLPFVLTDSLIISVNAECVSYISLCRIAILPSQSYPPKQSKQISCSNQMLAVRNRRGFELNFFWFPESLAISTFGDVRVFPGKKEVECHVDSGIFHWPWWLKHYCSALYWSKNMTATDR